MRFICLDNQFIQKVVHKYGAVRVRVDLIIHICVHTDLIKHVSCDRSRQSHSLDFFFGSFEVFCECFARIVGIIDHI